MPAATNVQAKKKAGSTVREHLPGLLKTRAIMQLITQTSNLTMSSREIAELLEKQHSHIKISAERLVEKGVIGDLKIRHFTHNGNTYTEYLLTERESIVLVAQNCPSKIGALLDSLGSASKDLANLLAALESFEVPDEVQGMYVYAIRNINTGHIKLGISRNPEHRLKQLQTGCDGVLELVAFRRAENGFSDERALHGQHSGIHIRGEWFGAQAATALAQNEEVPA